MNFPICVTRNVARVSLWELISANDKRWRWVGHFWVEHLFQKLLTQYFIFNALQIGSFVKNVNITITSFWNTSINFEE